MKFSTIKTITVALSLMAALVFAGCGSGSGSDSESNQSSANGVEGKKVTLLTVAQSTDYIVTHTEEFKKAAKAAGVDVTVVINDFDAAEQAQQINQAISTRPDAVVVWPADATAIAPSLQRLKQANIPAIVTNSRPQTDDTSLWTAYTGPDDIKNGQEAARAMIAGFEDEGFGTKGRVIVITGVPGTPPAIERLKGFEDLLAKEAPGIEVVGSQTGEWDQTQSTSASASLFTKYRDLQGVYAQADNMLAGTIVAAKRADLSPEKMVLVGSNCNIEGYENIKKGTQDATVLQSPIQDGRLPAEAVIKVLRGEKVEKNIYIEPKIITEKNLEDCAAAVGK